MSPILIVALVALCLVLLLAFLWIFACVKLFRFAFLRRKKQGRAAFPPDADTEPGKTVLAGIAFADTCTREEVFITADDGVRLAGYLYGAENTRATIILFHGYRSFAENDFGCVLSYYLNECALRVLLVDQRAHGASEGKYITFGILESRDCVAWAQYAAARFGEDCPIILDGLSMGSTTVMLASAHPQLPANVKGVIADCGFTSPDAILRKVGRDMHLPVSLFLCGVYALCRHVAHFDPLENTAPRALVATRLPVLMIHGTGDDYVPCEMSRENAAAGGERVRLLLVEGAGHAMSYLTDTETVKKALADFLSEHI